MTNNQEANKIEKEFFETRRNLGMLINMLACARYLCVDFLLDEQQTKEKLLKEKNSVMFFTKLIIDTAKDCRKNFDNLQSYLKIKKIKKN